MEVQIHVDSEDLEGTIRARCAALQEGTGLDPAKTEPGVRLAVEGHSVALRALVDASEPEKIGIVGSVSFRFAWCMMERSHHESTIADTLRATQRAAVYEQLAGDASGGGLH